MTLKTGLKLAISLLFLVYPCYGSILMVSDTSAMPGDTAVAVPIVLDNEIALSGIEYSIDYDASLLDLNRVEYSDRILNQSESGHYEYSPGHLSFVVYDLAGINVEPDSAIIMNMYFDVSVEVDTGSTAITISEFVAVDDALQYDEATGIDGSFLIWYGFYCGDVNKDYLVNLLDILILIDYIYTDPIGEPAPDPMESGDVNADEAINLLDILALISYIYVDPVGEPELICPLTSKYFWR